MFLLLFFKYSCVIKYKEKKSVLFYIGFSFDISIQQEHPSTNKTGFAFERVNRTASLQSPVETLKSHTC